MANATIHLTLIAAADGGLVAYEAFHDDDYQTPEQRLVFGGNLEEATKYLAGRMSRILEESGKAPKDEPRKIEAPKLRVRRRADPTIEQAAMDALDNLDALEAEAN